MTPRLARQGLINLLAEAEVEYPPRATKTALLDLVVSHRQGPFLEFLESTEKAAAVRTLESLARIELGAQGGALIERVTTTRTAQDGTATTCRAFNRSPYKSRKFLYPAFGSGAREGSILSRIRRGRSLTCNR